MTKEKSLSIPLSGMSRSTGGHFLSDQQFSFQLNGREDTDERYALTSEESNILATKFKTGFKFIGGKSHVVRDKTYIFITNPETRVSEIGCIQNVKDFNTIDDTEIESNCTDCPEFINKEAIPLEQQTQIPHQTYVTLLEDSCNLCLGFDIDYPIIDILIKEQNIGTKLFWTSTPGNKEFRYIELDDIEQYKLTGDDNCGETPTVTCLDCDKLRVFKLYKELKIKDYQRIIGGNLKKGSYEILGAYSDQLGNEFTSYTPLTPIIPIFDEANIIHEQVDNNAETNFAIKVELENVDLKFDYYKIAVRYYTSKGVFTSFIEGVHGTSDKAIILSDNNGISISNTKLFLNKPFVETVDGATASNNILILNGVKEREPINLQPVINLAGLGVQWMSFRAKENLYSNADSYKYIGYNRDENIALAIDFGMKDGYRTNPYVFIPRPPTVDELSTFNTGNDYNSINDVVGNCDGTIRNKKWQFYNSATAIGACPLGGSTDTVSQTEDIATYTTIAVPSATADTVVISLLESTVFTDLKQFIEDNADSCPTGPIPKICPFIDLTSLTAFNNLPSTQTGCDAFVLTEESIIIEQVNNEIVTFDAKSLIDYSEIIPPANCNIHEINPTTSEFRIDTDFSYKFNVDSWSGGTPEISTKYRLPNIYNTSCSLSLELSKVTSANFSTSQTGTFYHLNKGAATVSATSGLLETGKTYIIDSLIIGDDFTNVGYASDGVEFIATGTTPTVWTNSTYVVFTTDTIVNLQTTKTVSATSGTKFTSNLHEGALWYKTQVSDRDNFFIELSKETICSFSGSSVSDGNEVRVSFFDTCSSTSSFHSVIVDLNNHQFIEVTTAMISALTTDTVYVVIDIPIVVSEGYGIGYDDTVDFANAPTTRYRLAPLCGCFNVVDRTAEFESVTISYDSIDISKSQKYETECTFEIPVLKDCEPVTYIYGEMGHYESTDKYPDNSELYDSSGLTIHKATITNVDLLTKLNLYKDSETGTDIILSSEADFRCKNIRAYRLPDNKVSPFIRDESIASNSDSIISPLGITIDGEVINNMLDVAVDNNLITQKQRDDIIDYKIYRADSTLDRSVAASGLVFNTKKYVVDGEDINYFNYPFNSLGKDKYFPSNIDNAFDKIQVISPEFDYFRPSLPDEMSIQGYMFGKANSRVLPVEDHAKMVILGKKARSLASALALLEVIAEGIITTAQSAEVWRAQFGFSNSVNPVGIGLNIAVAALQVLGSVVYKVGRYRSEWLRSFENLGAPYNFGHYIASGSNYNYLRALQTDGDRLRGLSTRKYLKSGMLNVSDTITGEVTRINNIDREEAPFFSLGNYPVGNLNSEYTSFDNSDSNPTASSQLLSSEIGCHEGKSPEQLRNIASPYVAFKNYIPNQYGTIDSIKWIDTTYCIPIGNTGVCNGVLGGDTFISRHSKKRKVRIFETDLLGSADLTPFPYKFNSNYGEPKYYIDYKVNSEFTSSGTIFPDIFYDVQFDCGGSENVFYVKPPGKFYLYNISFTNFLCETRVNTNFRNARKEPWNQFYPQNTDYEVITQPTTVSLTRPESFFYNKAYLQTNILNTVFGLPEYYSKENEAKKAYNINSGIYSLPDVNENSITEPWLLYRPNDKFTLESRYGRLIGMKGIESDQILMYFEDALQLQNSINKFTDGSTQYNSDLGNGGMFAKRAITLKSTDLGYGGSQSKQTLSCEFGHFHADIKRGQIFNYMGGTSMQEISRYSNGKPNGMDVWFKEHLPLNFSKQFPDFVNLDNPYNGLGIHWGYDSKYRRVILTKKDYILAEGVSLTYDPNTNTFDGDTTLQDRIESRDFKEVSWTITYKPETGSWESYMSYTPNYYINHTDYFQSGINSEGEDHGLWSHLLTNKSYRVFYGQKFPYVIEYPIKNQYFSKRLEDFSWNAQLRRYHNEYDFAPIEANPFTTVTIYNNYENSGKLIPVLNNGTLSQLSKYPITKTDNTQEVLISYDNYRYNLNYFYNRTRSNRNNQPIWLWDENQIDKVINPKAVSFYGKNTLERLKGNFFIVRLERDGNTNYDLDFRWSENTVKLIQ